MVTIEELKQQGYEESVSGEVITLKTPQKAYWESARPEDKVWWSEHVVQFKKGTKVPIAEQRFQIVRVRKNQYEPQVWAETRFGEQGQVKSEQVFEPVGGRYRAMQPTRQTFFTPEGKVESKTESSYRDGGLFTRDIDGQRTFQQGPGFLERQRTEAQRQDIRLERERPHILEWLGKKEEAGTLTAGDIITRGRLQSPRTAFEVVGFGSAGLSPQVFEPSGMPKSQVRDEFVVGRENSSKRLAAQMVGIPESQIPFQSAIFEAEIRMAEQGKRSPFLPTKNPFFGLGINPFTQATFKEETIKLPKRTAGEILVEYRAQRIKEGGAGASFFTDIQVKSKEDWSMSGLDAERTTQRVITTDLPSRWISPAQAFGEAVKTTTPGIDVQTGTYLGRAQYKGSERGSLQLIELPTSLLQKPFVEVISTQPNERVLNNYPVASAPIDYRGTPLSKFITEVQLRKYPITYGEQQPLTKVSPLHANYFKAPLADKPFGTTNTFNIFTLGKPPGQPPLTHQTATNFFRQRNPPKDWLDYQMRFGLEDFKAGVKVVNKLATPPLTEVAVLGYNAKGERTLELSRARIEGWQAFKTDAKAMITATSALYTQGIVEPIEYGQAALRRTGHPYLSGGVELVTFPVKYPVGTGVGVGGIALLKYASLAPGPVGWTARAAGIGLPFLLGSLQLGHETERVPKLYPDTPRGRELAKQEVLISGWVPAVTGGFFSVGEARRITGYGPAIESIRTPQGGLRWLGLGWETPTGGRPLVGVRFKQELTILPELPAVQRSWRRIELSSENEKLAVLRRYPSSSDLQESAAQLDLRLLSWTKQVSKKALSARPTIGTPHLETTGAEFKVSAGEKGFVSTTKTALNVFGKNIPKDLPLIEQQKYGEGLELLKQVFKQDSAFLEKELPKSVRSLTPEQTTEAVRFAKQHGGLLYGSFPTQSQLMKGLRREAGDIDIYFDMSEQRAGLLAKQLSERLSRIGPKVSPAAEGGLLLTNIQKEHAIDIHARPPGGYSWFDRGQLFGMPLNQRVVQIGGAKAMRLSEQAIRKAEQVLSLRGPEGFGPQPHRTKDVPDLLGIFETLLRSGKKESYLPTLESFRSKWPKELQQPTTATKLEVVGPRPLRSPITNPFVRTELEEAKLFQKYREWQKSRREKQQTSPVYTNKPLAYPPLKKSVLAGYPSTTKASGSRLASPTRLITSNYKSSRSASRALGSPSKLGGSLKTSASRLTSALRPLSSPSKAPSKYERPSAYKTSRVSKLLYAPSKPSTYRSTSKLPSSYKYKYPYDEPYKYKIPRPTEPFRGGFSPESDRWGRGKQRAPSLKYKASLAAVLGFVPSVKKQPKGVTGIELRPLTYAMERRRTTKKFHSDLIVKALVGKIMKGVRKSGKRKR